MPEFPISVIRAVAQGSDPPAATNKGKLYAKSVTGVTQAHYRDDAGTITQLTPASLSNGVVTVAMRQTVYTVSGQVVMNNVTTDQPLYSAAWGSLVSGTMYRIRGCFVFTNAGTLAAVNFTLGGTWTNLAGLFTWVNTGNLATGNDQVTPITVATSTQLSNGGSSLANRAGYFNIIATPNANLTLWPNIKFSVANTPTLSYGSVEITPVGTSAFLNQGSWA